jgi:hypothetical protein
VGWASCPPILYLITPKNAVTYSRFICYEVQIIIIKLLWGGHLARPYCTLLHRKMLYISSRIINYFLNISNLGFFITKRACKFTPFIRPNHLICRWKDSIITSIITTVGWAFLTKYLQKSDTKNTLNKVYIYQLTTQHSIKKAS